jgi:DNA invertase Pin-like site-specific DNA recombinase
VATLCVGWLFRKTLPYRDSRKDTEKCTTRCRVDIMTHMLHDLLSFIGTKFMKLGYARSSTLEQVAGFEDQQVDLKKAGCDRFFLEQASSVGERAQLDAALDYLRDGDTLVVTKLDRLARSVRDLLRIVDRIDAKGAGLTILAMNLDTKTATGKLMLTVLASVAEFERQMMLERQAAGVAKAKAQGKYKGRAPTARAKAEQVEALLAAGERPSDVAKKLRIGRSSVYRAIADRDLKRRTTYRVA